jgi:hypothetical protein
LDEFWRCHLDQEHGHLRHGNHHEHDRTSDHDHHNAMPLHEHDHDDKYDGGLPVPASGVLSIVAG